MRLDDTNPSKEDEEYVQSILEDVKWIQSGVSNVSGERDAEGGIDNAPWTGPVRKTSDYFDLIYDCAEALILQGDAYVDSLSADEMREYRGTLTEPGKDSPYRTRTIEENMDLFRKVSCFSSFPSNAVPTNLIHLASWQRYQFPCPLLTSMICVPLL